MTSKEALAAENADAFGYSDRRARRALLALILIYAVVCGAIGCYRCWFIYRSSIDSAMLSQVIWASATGHGAMYSPVWAENFLAENFCPLILVLTPVFWVFGPGQGAFAVLLFCQSLAIGACAWPAYLIARRRIDDNKACLVLAMITVLYPTVLTQNFFQFIPHILGLPFILAALYFFEARAFGRFVLCCVLAASAKETFVLGMFMFAPVALFQRRNWKWAIFPLLFSTGFLLFYFKGIAPYFRGDAPMHSGMYLSYLGDSVGEILRRVFTEPSALADVVFRPNKLVYPFLLLAPLGVIVPFLGWPALLCIPDFCINMISDSQSFTVIGHHYGTVIGVFLCAGSAHGIARLSRMMSDRWQGSRNALILSIAMLFTCVCGWSAGFRLSDWDPLPHRAALTRAIEMVPPEASVACSEDLIVHLIYRRNACDNTMLRWRFGKARLGEDRQFEALTRFDYIVFQIAPAFFYSGQIREWTSRLLNHPAYDTLWFDDTKDFVAVFERRTKGLMEEFWKGNPEL